MEQVIQRLPVTEDIAMALVGRTGSMGVAVGLAAAYEHADWASVGAYADDLGLPMMSLPPIYAQAVREAGQLVDGASSTAGEQVSA